MIYFSFQLSNPFISESNFRNYFCKTGSITKHKHWELEAVRDDTGLIGIQLDTRWWGADHAGVTIEITIGNISISARMYDSRHWNGLLGRWEHYDT